MVCSLTQLLEFTRCNSVGASVTEPALREPYVYSLYRVFVLTPIVKWPVEQWLAWELRVCVYNSDLLDTVGLFGGKTIDTSQQQKSSDRTDPWSVRSFYCLITGWLVIPCDRVADWERCRRLVRRACHTHLLLWQTHSESTHSRVNARPPDAASLL